MKEKSHLSVISVSSCKNSGVDNNEEIAPGLTRRREAREDEQAAIPPNVEELSTVVVDAAFHLHRDLGPGLLESVYEAIPISILQFVLPGPLVLLLR